MKRKAVLIVVLVVAPGLFAQGRVRGRLADLVEQLRRIEVDRRRLPVRRKERIDLFEKIAALGGEGAARQLCFSARDRRHADVLGSLLPILAREFPHSAPVAELFRTRHMEAGDPQRDLARHYLVRWFLSKRDEGWLTKLYDNGTVEDRFLALAALGTLSSKKTLEYAERLFADTEWTAVPGTPYSCGSLAHAVRRFEGERAARFLILLERDPRFSEADKNSLKTATRLWKEPRLVKHIRLAKLADPDPAKRAAMASFLGEAGIEAARAPLLFLARRRDQPVEVRVAAVEALGGLKIARGHLALTLRPFLTDPQTEVTDAAVKALARLRVKQAAAILVELLGTKLEGKVRSALARVENREPKLDWKTWLSDPACPLPEGT